MVPMKVARERKKHVRRHVRCPVYYSQARLVPAKLFRGGPMFSRKDRDHPPLPLFGLGTIIITPRNFLEMRHRGASLASFGFFCTLRWVRRQEGRRPWRKNVPAACSSGRPEMAQIACTTSARENSLCSVESSMMSTLLDGRACR